LQANLHQWLIKGTGVGVDSGAFSFGGGSGGCGGGGGGTKLFPMIFRAFRLYSDSAQVGALRACPALAWNTVPCTPGAQTLAGCGVWGQYAFHAVPSLLDSLIADGERAVYAVALRDMLLAYIVTQVYAAVQRPT
jgi:hypothetical protein